MNPISLELNQTMEQAHARSRVRDKSLFMEGHGQVHWGRQQKKIHTHGGAGSLFPYVFVFKKKPSVFSAIVPKEFANNDAMLSSLDFLSFSFLLYLCNYI